ncbi:MAG: hypothetical protein PWR21_24 [Methanoculleus sp.]|jgi:hypothetical protein|uniref:hypothetical protein n=1 Tax=Methanoculleus sp. TaxID=90427 RepID=UPI0026353EC7|nr:hypothetical protein [Methanoculleus sp.]MDK2889393.1 hypothetical protein [Methanoculleus sp.]
MTESVARIIAAVVAIGVVCCALALIVAVHNDEGSDPGTGNVTPEGSPTGSNLPGDISRNATPQQVPGEEQEVENMTSDEIWERAQEIYWSWYRSGTVERMLEEVNMTPDELPDDVIEEMKNATQFEDIIWKWDVDPRNKQVVIHAVFAWNEEHEKELKAVQGRKVGDWTFNVAWEPYMLRTVRRALDAANMTPEELPDEVKEEMEKISAQIGGIRTWELDPRNRLVVAYAHFTWPNDGYETKVDAIQGREISGWTFKAVLEPDVPELMQRALDAANMTPDGVPKEVREELKDLQRGNNRTFSISKWGFDPDNKRVVLYAYSIGSERRRVQDEKGMEALQGREIGDWTLTVIHDVDYEKEREQLVAELLQFRKDHPELEIGAFSISPTELELWVANRTPANEVLNGTVMHGRTVELLWSPVDYAIRLAYENQ